MRAPLQAVGFAILPGLLLSTLGGGCSRSSDTTESAPAPAAATPTAAPAPTGGGLQLTLPDMDVSDLPLAVQTKIGDLRYRLRQSASDVTLVAELGALCYVHNHPRVAIVCFKHNISLEPNALAWWYYLGLAHERADEPVDAITAYEKALSIQEYPPVRARLAALKNEGGQPTTMPAAGTQPAPTFDALRENLLRHGLDVTALLDAAGAAIQDGQLATAAKLVSDALDVDDTNVRARTEMARLRGLQGKLEDAIRELRNILNTPEGARSVPTKVLLANFLALRKEYEQAEPLLREALAQSPEDADVLNSLAWVLAAHPDPSQRKPEEAVRLAEKACELTLRRNPALLDTLSVAYAAAGRFEDAKQQIGLAIRLAQEAKQGRALQTYEQRQALYERGQAHFETR